MDTYATGLLNLAQTLRPACLIASALSVLLYIKIIINHYRKYFTFNGPNHTTSFISPVLWSGLVISWLSVTPHLISAYFVVKNLSLIHRLLSSQRKQQFTFSTQNFKCDFYLKGFSYNPSLSPFISALTNVLA